MKICGDLATEKFTVFSDKEPWRCNFTNSVRNLKNGWRKDNEIVYATTGDREENGKYPVDPRKFPKGCWLITSVFEITRSHYKSEQEYLEAIKTFGKVVITTNAFRYTPIWSLENGYYKTITGKMVIDSQFWIHGGAYKTSWGCILVPETVIMRELAETCKEELSLSGSFPLEIT